MKLIKNLGYLYPNAKSKQKRLYGIYKCHCGKEYKANTSNVKRGLSPSCGCMRGKDSYTRLYHIWKGMRARCSNKNNDSFSHYGGRGILVCEEWKNSFYIFKIWANANGYSDSLSIDRINNDGNYEPSNCRWANNLTQARNTRKIQKNNTSGYRGVFAARVNWRAQIGINGKAIHLGGFKTKIEAAMAYDNYVIEHNLENTRNFK